MNPILTPDEKIEAVLSHIENVQRNCYKLGRKLIKKGEVEFGRVLICNGQIHDNSKFTGIEFDQLFRGAELLPEAVKHHSGTNPHHPEYWGGIQNMPRIYIAEMVCDCAARSAEQGSDLRKWLSEAATEKYNFKIDDRVGQDITYFLNMLIEQPFTKI